MLFILINKYKRKDKQNRPFFLHFLYLNIILWTKRNYICKYCKLYTKYQTISIIEQWSYEWWSNDCWNHHYGSGLISSPRKVVSYTFVSRQHTSSGCCCLCPYSFPLSTTTISFIARVLFVCFWDFRRTDNGRTSASLVYIWWWKWYWSPQIKRKKKTSSALAPIQSTSFLGL